LTLGEAILDRILASSHRLAMKGPSMRRRQPGHDDNDQPNA
jgi:DNA replication protein DnaC